MERNGYCFTAIHQIIFKNLCEKVLELLNPSFNFVKVSEFTLMMWKTHLTRSVDLLFVIKMTKKPEASSSENILLKNCFDKSHLFPLFLTLDILLNGFTVFNANNEFLL